MTNPEPSPPSPPSPPSVTVEVLAVVAAVAAFVGGGFWWALSPEAARPRRVERDPRATLARSAREFIGSQSCAACHPGESALQARCGHSRTLRPAAALELARWLDDKTVADPEIPGVSWTYALSGGRLSAARVEAGARQPLDLGYALGSGRHAVTFVSLTTGTGATDVPEGLEHRLTYFVRDRSLGITPGQRAETRATGVTPLGRHWEAAETLQCFGCHATRTSERTPQSLDVATMIPNVSCEACHGPARAHVENARRGATSLALPFGPGRWDADAQMQLCGRCHRLPAFIPEAELRPENPVLIRFQPVGLMRSRCYQRSEGALSCVNCHDPHARSSSDRHGYEAACLSCHREPPRVVCPVSPRTGCIDCHMPRRTSGNSNLAFSDHWIRVHDDPAPPRPSP